MIMLGMAARTAHGTRGGRWRLGTVAAGLCVLSAAPAAPTSKLSLVPSSAFIQGQATDGVMIEVENAGQDARGTVTINSSGGRTVYPIELPRGARKKFIGYPLTTPDNRYDEISCDLDTDRGSVHADVRSSYYGEQQTPVLEISDEIGGLQFLDEGGPRSESNKKSVYVKPEDAPGRLIAYRRMGAVVLGPGAERMQDAAVQAVKEYVAQGGRLVFVGGAAAPVFTDRRWADVLPLSGVHGETRDVTLVAGGARFSSRLDVQAGIETPGSTRLPGGVVSHPVGLGVVVAIPFDLLQGPIKAWSGRAKFLTSLAATPTGSQLLASTPGFEQNGYGGQGQYMYSSSPGGYRGSRYYPPGAPVENDPFSFEPPQPTSVYLIIVCYLIVVAPVNFFVLRKLRRSELAWFTTPCISIIFAGCLLKLAASLYAGKMMTSAQGTLVIAEAVPDSAVFRGSSQLFFPTGGSYDLKLSGIDWLAPADEPQYGPSGPTDSPMTALDLDTGTLMVPGLSVRNLQFKELAYEQLIDAKGWLNFSVHRKGKTVDVTVTNTSPYTVTAGSLYVEGATEAVPELAPGATKSVSVPVLSEPGSFRAGHALDENSKNAAPPPGLAPDWNAYSWRIHRPILSATLAGFRPGPQIGNEVAGRGGFGLVAVGAEPTGGRR